MISDISWLMSALRDETGRGEGTRVSARGDWERGEHVD
jgi:hypothetical protein